MDLGNESKFLKFFAIESFYESHAQAFFQFCFIVLFLKLWHSILLMSCMKISLRMNWTAFNKSTQLVFSGSVSERYEQFTQEIVFYEWVSVWCFLRFQCIWSGFFVSPELKLFCIYSKCVTGFSFMWILRLRNAAVRSNIHILRITFTMVPYHPITFFIVPFK